MDQKKYTWLLFICFASKAVHLEVVFDLTAACIAALRTFVARRGCPKVLYSDNDSTSIGSRIEQEALQRILERQQEGSLHAEAAALLTKWVYLPPRAPHFGGLWEA